MTATICDSMLHSVHHTVPLTSVHNTVLLGGDTSVNS